MICKVRHRLTWKFLLSNFYTREAAENLQMHLLVEQVDAWWGRIAPI